MVADKPEQDTLSKLYAEWVSAAVKLSVAGISATAKMMEASTQAAYAAKQKTSVSPASATRQATSSATATTNAAKPQPTPAPVTLKPVAKAAPKPKVVVSNPVPIKATPVAASQTQPATSADDLKRISGIGPKLEQMLLAKGITSFSQVAKWTNADVDKLDAALGLSGRVTQDDWVGQAKQLISNRTGS